MISRFFIDRPIFANVIAIVTVLFGVVALNQLPVERYPSITPPTVQVTTNYPGANAKFTIYEDDNETYNYEKGQRATYELSWNDAARTLTIGARQGSFPGMVAKRQLNIVLATPGRNAGTSAEATDAKTVLYTGQPVEVKFP